VTPEPRVDHPPTGGHERKEERSEKLAEQPAPLVHVAQEVEPIAQESGRVRKSVQNLIALVPEGRSSLDGLAALPFLFVRTVTAQDCLHRLRTNSCELRP
jgi:hypothetical protein